MKKLTILAITAALTLNITLIGCTDTEEKPPIATDEPEITTNDSTKAPETKTAKQPATEKEPPTEEELPNEDDIVVDEEDDDNADVEVPDDPNGYTEINQPQLYQHGNVPRVLNKHIPNGTPDHFTKAKKLIDYNKMTVYVGIADLLDPDGYRHLDASGSLHPSSVIKMWIAEYAYLQVEAGKANLSTSIGNGSSLKYYISEMMGMSCNVSTAHIISYFGRANIDNWLQKNYHNTRLHADLRGNYSEGRTNATSVRDTITLLEKIYHNRNRTPYQNLYNDMLNARTRAKLPAAMERYPEVRVATKTGSFIHVTTADHDVGIIIGRDKNGNIETAFAIAIYTFSQAYKPTFSTARPTLYGIARLVYESFRDEARKPKQQEITTTTAPPATKKPPKTTTKPPKATTEPPRTTASPPRTTRPPQATTQSTTTSAEPPEITTEPPALE